MTRTIDVLIPMAAKAIGVAVTHQSGVKDAARVVGLLNDEGDWVTVTLVTSATLEDVITTLLAAKTGTHDGHHLHQDDGA